jgi:histone acetyltransferase (RNA polymerase elongator complex component)
MLGIATALGSLGMRYGPTFIRGIGKALGFTRKVGQGLQKVKRISGQVKKPAQMVVGGIFGAGSEQSKAFNKYSDKFDEGVNKASDVLDTGLKQADQAKASLGKIASQFKTRPKTEAYV